MSLRAPAAAASSSEKFRRWTKEDELRLDLAIARFGFGNWTEIASFVGDRTPRAVHKHHAQREAKRAAVGRRGAWSAEEERRLEEAFLKHGNNWDEVAREIGGGRTPHGVQLHHAVKRRAMAARAGSTVAPKSGHWSPEEDDRLVEAHERLGTNWVEIAKAVGGRTPEAVRMRLHGKLQRSAALGEDAVQLNSGAWSLEEERRFAEAYAEHGNKWVQVARHVRTRTPKSVMAHWSRLQLKLQPPASPEDREELLSLPSSVGSFVVPAKKRRRLGSDHSLEGLGFSSSEGESSPRLVPSGGGVAKDDAKEIAPAISVSLDVLVGGKQQQARAGPLSATTSIGSWQACCCPAPVAPALSPPRRKRSEGDLLSLLAEAALGQAGVAVR